MPNKKQAYQVDKSEFVFGRGGKSDVIIQDAGISREHLRIKYDKNILHVMDLNSLNGTYIDGYRINPNEYIAFQDKATLSFGKCPVTIKVRVKEEASVASPTAAVVVAAAVSVSPEEDFEIVSIEEELKKAAAEKAANSIDADIAAHIPNPNESHAPAPEPASAAEIMASIPAPTPMAAPAPAPQPSTPVVEIATTEVSEVDKDKTTIELPEKSKLVKVDYTVIQPKRGKIEIKEPPKVRQNLAGSLSDKAPPKGHITPGKPEVISPLASVIDQAPGPNDQKGPDDNPAFNKLIDLSAFPKSEEDYRLSFKNVGLDLPKYKNPGEHAKEIIKEAEYQKYAIIKSAEVFKSKTINDTRILSKKASEEAYTEFKKMVDHLLENTRIELKKLRTDTEILLDEKRLQANEEIQRLWEQHEDQVRQDKVKQLDTFEKENKIKLDLSIEKTRSDMFAERHKILTDAETEVLQKKRAFQVEFENEKSEHLAKVKIYTEELQKTQFNIEENKKIAKESKALKENSEVELSKTLSQLKAEKEALQIIQSSFKETQDSHKVIEHELATFNDTKQKALTEIEKTQGELSKLNNFFSLLTEKKQKLDEEIQSISEYLKDAKAKAKAEVEAEYTILKNNEAKKFDDFKANELKDLQKIRDAHSESIKNFSVDLSQEIATKLELLASKSGFTKFDFEKHFELINSVIQIKSAINTGSESKHAQQLEGWKNRKRKENFSLMARGFAAGLICIFIGNAVYKKLNVDPVQEELARISLENKKQAAENRYFPEKSDRYYDNYVETTLYTDRFAEIYLDKNNQREWVNYATKYFLRQWKVEEEKVIQVISNSNALVQSVNEMIPSMKKTKYKADIAKMKEMEDEYVQKQALILGTNVKYEAYKKIEKEFFQSKLQGRVPASL